MTTESRTPGLSLIHYTLPLATCLMCLTTLTHAWAAPPAEAGAGDERGADAESQVTAESEQRVSRLSQFGQKGAFEFGGSVGIDWTNDAFGLDVSPTVGYFVMDRVELSALLRISYEDQKDDSGDRESVKSGAIVLEPSYHLPVREEVFVFAGLGFGVGHDDEDFDFEMIPRVGLNIGVALVGVLTPSLKMPILVDNDGTSAGLGLELGYSAVW